MILGTFASGQSARTNYNQTDPAKADYLIGRENIANHIASKDNPHGVSTETIGALPIDGGKVTGALDVNGGVVMWKDSEGGNIDIFPPSANTLTNHWEIDSHNGELRFYVDRKASNPNGSGIITPLRLLTDGSIEVYAKTKTLENLGAAPASHVTDKTNPHGVTAAQVGARPSTWTPTAAEVGAIAATSTSLSGMSVKAWAASLTSSAWAYTDSSTLDMPVEVSAATSYAVATANVAANGGWIELRLRYVLTGCEAVAYYNYGWSPWDWVTPPMTTGVEYRTTERFRENAVYVRLVDFGAAPASGTRSVTFCDANFYQDAGTELLWEATNESTKGMVYLTSGTPEAYAWVNTATGAVTISRVKANSSSLSAKILAKYTKTTG